MQAPAPNASVGDVTFGRLRTDIIFGRLRPGEKLRLQRLKSDYGASVSTLRESLNRLASEGFVMAEDQRGFRVAGVSMENLQEVAALRALLECYALELSFAAGDVDWEGRVVAAHHKLHQMERRMAEGDRSIVETWKRFDWEFHQALIMACGSQTLLETHGTVFDKYLRYQMLALTFRGEVAAREHLELKEAALARDASGAQEILRRHIEGGVAHVKTLERPPPARLRAQTAASRATA